MQLSLAVVTVGYDTKCISSDNRKKEGVCFQLGQAPKGPQASLQIGIYDFFLFKKHVKIKMQVRFATQFEKIQTGTNYAKISIIFFLLKSLYWAVLHGI